MAQATSKVATVLKSLSSDSQSQPPDPSFTSEPETTNERSGDTREEDSGDTSFVKKARSLSGN